MKPLRLNRKIVLEIIFILFVPILIFSSIIKEISPNETAYKILFFGLLFFRTVIILDLIKYILIKFHSNFIVTKQAENRTNRKLISISLTVCVLIFEIVFQFVPQNQDVYNLGLATKVWNAYYKNDDNEKGFRDKLISSRIQTNKNVVFFLGDSFTYGNGIKEDKDRYTDIVASRIDSTKFELFNLGKGNSDTRDELLRLVEFGVKPNIVILQYYHNDIEKIGTEFGHFKKSTTGYKNKEESSIKKIITTLVLSPLSVSFFINYIGLNSSKFLIPKSQNNYKECLSNAYNDTKCLNEHLNDMKTILNYCKLCHAKLYVLFLPDPRDINYTQQLFDTKVRPFLKNHSVPVITVDVEFKKHPISELVVNPLNAHTNAFANQIISNQIIQSVTEFSN